MDAPLQYETRVGRYKIVIKQGNITEETTDAIVNSSNADLDLSRGQVSRAILEAAGPTIQEECKGKVRFVTRVAVTTSGQLPCRHIIHVNMTDIEDWREAIQNALQRAKLMRLESVAFPAIGTGNIGAEAKTCAKMMFDAFTSFANNPDPSCLKEIHVVLFSSALTAEFITAGQEHFPPVACLQPEADPSVEGVFAAVDNLEPSDAVGSYCPPDTKDTKTQQRKLLLDSITHKIDAMTLPHIWTEPSADALWDSVPLEVTSEEYRDAARQVRESGLTEEMAAIDSIHRIQNKSLYQEYGLQKATMDKKLPGRSNETRAFHGTSKDVIENICGHGFNRSYCGKNAVRLGQGVYFSTGAKYSTQERFAVTDESGLKYLFLCRVLTGDFVKGNQSNIEPPLKSDGRTRYDSVVDDVNNPTIYVVFRDARAYPDHLITLKM